MATPPSTRVASAVDENSPPDADLPNKRAVRRGFRPVSLDAVNFLLSDMQGALGPYLVVFLVTQEHWSKSSVGLVTTIGGLIGLTMQMPIGMLIDATRAKRGVVVVATIVLAAGATAIFLAPSFWPVLLAYAMMAVVGDVFGPAIAAITLGLYTRDTLARRTGRNAAFDHAGNVSIAIVTAGIGYYFSQRGVFLLVPIFGCLVIAAILSIPADAIDYSRARGADPLPGAGASDQAEFRPARLLSLAKMRALGVFAGCALLYQFANAPLLALAGQKLAIAHPDVATALTSACIIIAQFVMMPIALLVGRSADGWGRKPLLLVAFAVLPIRALLYTVSDDAAWLLGVQVLDGVGAGIFITLLPLLVADITQGTGRYNMALGTVITVQGIGGSLSGLAVGLIVDHFGYGAAFVTMAICATIAGVSFWFFMPETLRRPTAEANVAKGVERPGEATSLPTNR
jgi:MFS family permease